MGRWFARSRWWDAVGDAANPDASTPFRPLR